MDRGNKWNNQISTQVENLKCSENVIKQKEN